MSEVSKPKSDTLSREQLIEWANSGLKGILHYIEIRDPPIKHEAIKEAKQAYEQIKAMLQPVPEEKSRKFVEKWSNEIDSHVYKGWIFDIDLIKQMLKEYDELKEGE